jgi:hypothetical protein
MKTNKRLKVSNWLVALFFIFCAPPVAYAQLQQGKYGITIPPTDTIRVLILYAEVQYDNSSTSCTEPAIFQSNGWPTDQTGTLPPDKADSLFDPVVPNDGILKGWFSSIYQDASFSNYYVLGDYYPNVLKVSCTKVQSDVNGVIEALNNEPGTYDSINGDTTLFTARGLPLRAFDKYDLLNGIAGQPKAKTPNGRIDAIFVVWRNAFDITGGAGCHKGFGLALIYLLKIC